LWVAGYRFCENVHADRHCDPRDARLAVHLSPQMVHLQTAWNSTTRIKEVRRVNAVFFKRTSVTWLKLWAVEDYSNLGTPCPRDLINT